MKRTLIRGTGRYLPERLVTNEDMTQWMDTSDEWIRKRTGIEQRYWIKPEGETGASDLGLYASNIALEKAGWTAKDLDLIIFATLSPDITFPGSGCLLQHKLGLTDTPALDIRQQCTGFIYGLATADAYIRSGLANRILFVGAEVHSTGLDISTKGRDVTVIFGDGAAAVCLEGVETEENIGVLASVLHAQGEFAESLCVEAPASRIYPSRIDHQLIDEGRHYPRMNGKLIFKMAVTKLPEVTLEVMARAGMTSMDEIDLIIPHQANLRINEFYQEIMKLPAGKIYNNIQKYGNTTAATIPLALDEVMEQGRYKKGDTVLFLGLGAGVTWGANLYRHG
ncbi:MAG: beta-ketoacyl-ACP synthase III [Thermodesulfobacteriota bacterium]